MAETIYVRAVCDGYDVQVVSDVLGGPHLLHFADEPTQQQIDDAVVSLEERHTASLAETEIADNMEVIFGE